MINTELFLKPPITIVAMVAERMPTLKKDAEANNAATELGDLPEDNFLVKVTAVLLNARQILAASYALGYFIPDDKDNHKDIHESLQVGWPFQY